MAKMMRAALAHVGMVGWLIFHHLKGARPCTCHQGRKGGLGEHRSGGVMACACALLAKVAAHLKHQMSPSATRADQAWVTRSAAARARLKRHRTCSWDFLRLLIAAVDLLLADALNGWCWALCWAAPVRRRCVASGSKSAASCSNSCRRIISPDCRVVRLVIHP